MDNVNTVTTPKNITLAEGRTGSGHPVHIVHVDWVKSDGRTGRHMHRFETIEEAKLFIEHAYS